MLKFIRYALAIVCFALSVGCLALWGWTATKPKVIYTLWCELNITPISFQAIDGIGVLSLRQEKFEKPRPYPQFDSRIAQNSVLLRVEAELNQQGLIGWYRSAVFFPLWYAALIFALAGVATLRLGRFTLRSALIATTAVAGLLGMVVAL